MALTGRGFFFAVSGQLAVPALGGSRFDEVAVTAVERCRGMQNLFDLGNAVESAQEALEEIHRFNVALADFPDEEIV